MTDAVRRRLPGKARPRAEVLQELQAAISAERNRIAANIERNGGSAAGAYPLALLLGPRDLTENDCRWRIQLDCGCIREVVTPSKDFLPMHGSDHTSEARLPTGQFLCDGEHERPEAPEREIIEWVYRSREHTYAPDPVEPPEYMADDPALWAKMRHDEERTFAVWSVKLSCGHTTTMFVDPAWKPEDGCQPTITVEEQAARRSKYMQLLASTDEADRGWVEKAMRRLERRLPEPDSEKDCDICPRVRSIVAYEYVGPLLVPEKPVKPKAPSRTNLERRLQQAEAEAARLREQLSGLDEKADE